MECSAGHVISPVHRENAQASVDSESDAVPDAIKNLKVTDKVTGALVDGENGEFIVDPRWSVLHFGAYSLRRHVCLRAIQAAGVRVVAVPPGTAHRVFGDALTHLIAGAGVVVSLSTHDGGRSFPCYMRVVQAIGQSVAVVSERGDGDNGLDAMERAVARLGGVYFARYAEIPQTVKELLQATDVARALRLTIRQREAWTRFRRRLYAWNGTYRALRELWNVESE